MIKTATDKVNLEAIEQLLQKRLHSELLQIAPLGVSCLLRDETLIILVHSPEPVTPDSQQVFPLLKQALENEQLSGNYRVLTYLILHGQEQPDAFSDLIVKLTDREIAKQVNAATADSPEKMPEIEAVPNLGEQRLVHSSDSENVTPNPPLKLPFSLGNLSPPPPVSPSPPLPLPPSLRLSPEKGGSQPGFSISQSSLIFWDSKISESGCQVNDLPDQQEKKKISKLQLPLIAVGTGISLAILVSGLYSLTHPCAIGKCQVIPQAKHLAGESAKILEHSPSTRAVFAARQQLVESIAILQSIPPWSSYRSEGENLVKTYRERLEILNKMVKALEIGAKAASIAKNPPFPVSKWEKIQQLWQEAIALLAQLPSDSELHSFGQIKIQEYQRNLAAINQRLKAERQATASLKAAKQAVKIAQVRQNNARSLSDWQLVHATWKTAAHRLEEIPSRTTSHEEAQQLLESYMPELRAARSRKNQEKFALNIYNQATSQAQLAKKSESLQKWSEAISHWRNALSYIKQVPKNTFPYSQAQPSIASYTKALSQAKDQLRVTLKLEQARSDLERTCSAGATKICDYTTDNHAIAVHLTPTYTQQVQQTALQAKAEANVQTQVELLNHISTLEQSLKAISRNTGIRVEVYNSDRILIVTYKPG